MEGRGRWGTHGRVRVALGTRENNTTYTHPAPLVPHTYSTHPLAPHSPCKPHMPHMVHALPHVVHTLPLTPLCMVAPWKSEVCLPPRILHGIALTRQLGMLRCALQLEC